MAAATSKFKINRYNWLAQKLAVQRRHDAIIQLRSHLEATSQPISEHLIYLSGAALLSAHPHGNLEKVIGSLQRLNVFKNNQHFLLLCQCLVYLGRFESVIALCSQLICRDLKSSIELGATLERETDPDLVEEVPMTDQIPTSTDNTIPWQDLLTENLLRTIKQSSSLREPKLWFSLGLSLEFERRLDEAETALRVAAHLVTPPPLDHQDPGTISISGGSNYVQPSERLAYMCAQYRGEIREAVHLLSSVARLLPRHRRLNAQLAAWLCQLPVSNSSNNNLDQASQLIASLEAHSATNRNPAANYNRLAARFKHQLDLDYQSGFESVGPHETIMKEPDLEELQASIDYLLAKGYVGLTKLAFQRSLLERQRTVAKDGQSPELLSPAAIVELQSAHASKLLESFRLSHPSCWRSAGLWNNIGLCFLIKQRHIASLSSLTKAMEHEPLDWRIHLNLALVCLKLGLVSKSLIHLSAARRFRSSSEVPQTNQLITNLSAICYDIIGEPDEARRIYLTALNRADDHTIRSSATTLVNYMIFLHKHHPIHEKETLNLKLRLLDQLEQLWLQRDNNDTQFNRDLLQVASRIGLECQNRSLVGSSIMSAKKTYAWTKLDSAEV